MHPDLLVSLGEVAAEPVEQTGATSDFIYIDISSVDRESKKVVSPKTIPASEAPNRAKQVLRAGDVVVSMTRPNLNAVALIPEDLDGAIGSTGFHVLRSKWIKPEFLFGLVQTDGFIEAMCDAVQGALYPAVRPKDVSSFQFILQSSSQQIRIIAKLEELLSDLDAGVAELQAAQKKLGQYRQSLLKSAVEGALTAEWREQHQPTETGAQLLQRTLAKRRARWEAKQLAKFNGQGKTLPKDWKKKYPDPVQPNISDLPQLPEGWVWASVEQIASDERYSLSIGPFGSNLKVPDYREAGVPLVFVRNIRSGNYGGAHTKYVTPEKAEELGAHSVAAGDVLVTKMGEPPGDADVYPDDQPPGIITADCIKIRCWDGLMNPHFLKSVINSHIGQRQIEPMTQGVAQKKVSLGRFTGLAVPVPPIDEQSLIMSLVDAADNEAAAQRLAIELALKQSAAQRKNILKAAFSGQLVPQDTNDESASLLLERIRAERAERAKQPKMQKAKQRKGIATVVSKLIDVLAEAGDWLPAQEAFRRCGVADGAQTEQIEALYAELRELDKSGRLAVEAVTDTQGRKLHDRLKLLAT
nr:hypothetical protein [Paraburkholderia panacisoli]